MQITILVRKPGQNSEDAPVYVAHAPDYFKLQPKLDWLKNLKLADFETVPVNKDYYWQDITDESYQKLLPVISRQREETIMTTHATGITTGMDDYVYDWSRSNLEAKIKQLIVAYDEALGKLVNNRSLGIEDVINCQDRRIKWTAALKSQLARNAKRSSVSELEFEPQRIQPVMYRPFVKKWLYIDDRILSSCRSLLKLFLQKNESLTLRQPATSRGGFTTPLAINNPADLNNIPDGGGFSLPDGNHSVSAGDSIHDYGNKRSGRLSINIQSDVGSSTSETLVYRRPFHSLGENSSPLASSVPADLHCHTYGGGSLPDGNSDNSAPNKSICRAGQQCPCRFGNPKGVNANQINPKKRNIILKKPLNSRGEYSLPLAQ